MGNGMGQKGHHLRSCHGVAVWILSSWSLVWGGGLEASQILAGSTPGERIYAEDFTNPATVDAGAGPGPGLDQTEIDGGDRLIQITATGGTFTYEFDDPNRFTFDPGRISVEGSLARLGDSIFGDLLGYWRMEEPSWSGAPGEVGDSSGNGFVGTGVGDANTIALGQVGRGSTFDGNGDAVVIGQPPALDLDPASAEFTLAAWFRTTSRGAILSKAVDNFGDRQFYMFTIDGRLWGVMGGNQNFGTITGLDDGDWHHGAVVNFDDNGVMRYAIYVDGVLDSIFDSGTATNVADVMVGARRVSGNSGLGFLMDGEIDEAMIVGRALSAAEIAGLYNGGAGRVVQEFPADGPAIFKTAGDRSPGLTDFVSFTETLGAGNEGSVEYQLSTNGTTWQFWNGVAWGSAGATEHNDAATVNANIGAFDASSETLFVRAFLLSDGSQRVELDRLEVGFERNFAGAFTVPFEAAANYTFDPAKIRVDRGLAGLVAEPPYYNDLLAYWRMEEPSWNGTFGEVTDSSGRGHHGTAGGAANTLAPGRLGRAGRFGGGGDLVSIGQPPDLLLDPDEEFTLSAWFRTTTQGAILSKAVDNFGQRQFYIFTAAGRFWGVVGGVQSFGATAGVNDGEWHHGVLVNFDDAGTMRYALYLDGAVDGVFDTGPATNGADVMIGARRVSGNSGVGFQMDGEIDEVAIFDRALSPAEVSSLYNVGAARLRTFPADRPPIFETAGDSDAGLTAYTRFTESLGAGHEGAVEYQLSADGASWSYWDGAAWVPAGLGDSNPAAVVDANLGAFDASAQQLFVRAFLVSDGLQAVELDHLSIRYDTDQGAGATEILGPITAGFQFLELRATVEDEDADHFVTFRLLEGDAATPVSDTLLPGNGAGFSSAAAAAGIDLGNLGAGDLYVQVRFSNLAMDDRSAALDELRITYLDFNDDSDLSLAKTVDLSPVAPGDDLTYFLAVSNGGPSAGFSAQLTDTLTAGLEFVSLAAPSGWTCSTPAVGGTGTVVCDHPLLPVGGPFVFSLVVTVPESYSGRDPIVNSAAVTAAKDTDPGDNGDSVSTPVESPAPGSITVRKEASPPDGTDFPFTGELGSFTLDHAVPDDGDPFGDSIVFPALAPGSYEVTASLPPAWRRTGFSCTSNELSLVFRTAYSQSGLYTFESNKIEVVGGLARLREDPLRGDLRGYWRMEEGAWSGAPGEVLDTSGSGHHGTALGGASTVAGGLVGRGGTFDGTDDHLVIGQPALLDFDPAADEFTLAAWFRTSENGAIIAKADDDFAARQYYLFVFEDRLWASIGGNLNFGGSIGAADGEWHHGAVVNLDDNGIMRYILYFDGQAIGRFDSGTATNDLDVLLGARRDVGNVGTDFRWRGELDEALIVGRALSATEIADLYAGGAGRIVGELATDGPSVVKTAGDSDQGILAFTGFTEVPGPGNQGTIEYQLSTNGAAWRYWDGAAWVPALAGESNDAATVDANIGAFDPASGRLFLRAFLRSDGQQRVEIDRLDVAYQGLGLGGTTIADTTATLRLRSDQDLVCTFVHEIDPEQLGSITLRKDASPPDGTDFSFSGDLGSFVLDDADPDDGDGVADTASFENLAPGTYDITESLPAGWSLEEFNCDPGPTSGSFDLTFSDPAAYTFDPSQIEVADGVARLRDDQVGLAMLGYWRMEEASWNGTPGEVLDSSGNGLDGRAEGDADIFPVGLIGSTGTFDGNGDLVSLGQPSALNLNPAFDEFTLAAWFKSPGAGALISKADDDFGSRQFYLFVLDDRVWANIGGSQNESSLVGALDDEWHHAAVVNFNNGTEMRYTIYLDGVPAGEFPSGTATNSSDIMIGARRNVGNSGSDFLMNGEIDEVMIVGRALTSGEVAGLYNGGAGRIVLDYPNNRPPIFETAGRGGVGLLGLTGFAATAGPSHEGDFGFQLSVDGASWQFWDGTAWVAASDGDLNDAATVNARIGAFDVGADQVFVRAFLLSDGTERVELDQISITFDRLSDLPAFTLAGETASLDLAPGADVVCTFRNQQDTGGTGTVVLVQRSDPADGTDFPYSGDLGTFGLDFALPDDGDTVPGSLSFGGLAPGSYAVSQDPLAGWTLADLACSSDDPGDTSLVAGSTVTLDVDAGETLICTFDHLRLLTQITDTDGTLRDNAWVAVNGDGAVASFTSTRNLTGGNRDLSSEIFVRTVAGFEQITAVAAPAEHAGKSALSRDGRFVVFESSADLLGTNADGNLELFRHDRQLGDTVQLTFTTGCGNAEPSVSDDGQRVAFMSNCGDLVPGFNGDGNLEVVVWHGGALSVVETTGCESLEPSLAGAAGDLVAFHSDCAAPYGMGNIDRNQEIYLWQWSAGAAGYTQLTDSAALAGVFNETVSISGDGEVLAYTSSGDYAGGNGDQSAEVFRHDRGTGLTEQLTDRGIFVSHSSAALDREGRHVAFEVLDFLGGLIGEIHHVDGATGVASVVARDPVGSSEFPATAATASGKAVIFFESSGDFSGAAGAGNGDGNVEIWRVVVEPPAVPSPTTRLSRGSTEPPTSAAVPASPAAVREPVDATKPEPVLRLPADPGRRRLVLPRGSAGAARR